MTARAVAAGQAAYRALAPFRLQAEVRRDAAVQIVAELSEIPAELLPGVVNLGLTAGVVGRLCSTLPFGRDAVAAGVAAAAYVLYGGGDVVTAFDRRTVAVAADYLPEEMADAVRGMLAAYDGLRAQAAEEIAQAIESAAGTGSYISRTTAARIAREHGKEG